MMGVFVEVTASFLPVGHTHEDIDQLFSRTASHLRHSVAVTLDDLAEQLRLAYTPRPTVAVMRHVANFSKLLIDTGCLRHSIPPFSAYRFFKFSRRADAGNSPARAPYRTQLNVKINCTDDWASLPNSPNAAGFLRSCPNISATPPTEITQPPNLHEVTQRIDSVETMVGNRSKMESLYKLRDDIYRDRVEPFHWDLHKSPELHGRHKTKSGFTDPALPDEEEDVSVQPLFDYCYNIDDFVAVRTTDAQCPFWIGQIKQLFQNDQGVVHRVMLQWYQPYNPRRGSAASSGAQDIYKAPYTRSFNENGTNGRVLWTDVVSVCSILVTFHALNTNKRLSVEVQKRIRSALGTLV